MTPVKKVTSLGFKEAIINEDFTIKSCGESVNFVCICVEFSLGQEILENRKMNTITQHYEATNCPIRRSLPKRLTFLNNHTHRAHSASHSTNHGPS